MHGKDDHLVDYQNSKFIYDNVSSSDKELLILQSSYHVITVDYDKNIVFNKIYEFIQKYK
jgi:carboxylesterase